MKIKVSKRLIALALTLLLCVTSFPAFANTYSGGPRDYELDRSLLVEAKNVSVEGNTLNFKADGTIKFDVLLPFDAAGLILKYEVPSKDVKLKVKTDKYSYEAVLAKETTETTVAITEVSGSHTIRFTADRDLILKGINFHKVDEQYNEKNKNAPNFTEYEEAMVTLVALNCDIGVIKTRNNLLRWDPENIYLAPKNINGSIYAPAKKLAEALQLYCEDYEDLSYLYMLGETSSLSLKNGKGFYEDNENGQKNLTVDVKYENGIAWVPVRKVAELFGFTVNYKDGYVLIGDRLRIKKVFEDNSLFRTLKDELNTYKIPSKKPEGKTYHVAQTEYASDANSGAKEYPFRTIGKAAEVAKAGDTVIVHEGTYREIVKPKNNGTAMAPIVFRAADGEKVVISALEKLSGFIDYKDDVVCAAVTTDLGFGRNQLFYKGEQLIEGRHPNEDTKPDANPHPPEVPKGLYATKGNIRITEFMGNKAYSSTDLEQDEENYWKGGTYVSLKGAGWSMVSGDIIASTKGMLTLKDHEGTVSYNLGIDPSVFNGTHYYYDQALESDYAYITNHYNTMDIPGEWFMKDNVMYLIPPEGADLEKDFEVKQRQLCIDLRNKMYITFDGIDTIGGSMTAQEATGVSFLNGEFKNIAHHTVILDASGYTMYLDEDPRSHDTQKKGEAGFYFGGQYNSMVNCVIDRSSAMGVALRDKYHYINNCIIKNCSYSGSYPGNIDVSGDAEKLKNGELAGGHFVTYNTLYNGGRGVYNAGAGLDADGYVGSSPTEFAYNRCFNGALVTRDTGVVYEYGYTAGNDVAKTAMHHNYVYDPGQWDKDEGSKLMCLYHDGLVASRDTYSNLTWYDDPNRPVTPKHMVFVQNAKWSVLRSRNNVELGLLPEGEAMIEKSDFPGTRTFGVGADFGEYGQRYMVNYENHDKGVLYEKPADITINEETGAETFLFEDVDIEAGGTILNYYMEREVGAPQSFNVVAKLYDQNGTLVYEAENPSTDASKRFYVYELLQGVVVLTKLEKGTYDIELEFSDSSSNVRFIMPKFFDVRYDNRYTKTDEEAGVAAYNPVGSSLDEETGKETFHFEDVKLSSEGKTLFKIHLTRRQNKEKSVDIRTYVYDANGEVVASGFMNNNLQNTTPQKYEVLIATMVIPEVPDGAYAIDFELSDEHSDIVRILPSVADPIYDNLYDYPEVFMGASWDEWTEGDVYEAGFYPSKSTNYSASAIANFTYWTGGNCWDHNLYYKDRTITKAAKMLRVSHSSGPNYSGSTVDVYVDSLDSEPIASWVVPDTNWQPETQYVNLTRKLEPGTYTFIFDFDGDNLCPSIYNFSFCNEVWDMDKED